MTVMETILIQVNSKSAYKLLKNLEELKLIKILEREEESKKKPSEYFGTLSLEESEKFHNYLLESREEWNRDI